MPHPNTGKSLRARLYEKIVRSGPLMSGMESECWTWIGATWSGMGATRASLAREYGVSEPSILAVVRRRSWAHVCEVAS